jgi:hypothetical protein
MKLVRIVTTAAVACGILGAAAGPAAAAVKPKITFTMAGSATAGTGTFKYSFTDAHIPKGGKLLLQHLVGTAHVWSTLATLHGKSGHAAVRPSGMGLYTFRLVVVDKHGKGLVAIKRNAKAYADIPLSQLCVSAAADNDWAGCAAGEGSSVVGTTQFPWVLNMGVDTTPMTIFTLRHTTCRSMHLVMGVGNEQNPGSFSITASVIQQTADPVTTTFAAAGVLAPMDVPLHPGTDFSLQMSTDRSYSIGVVANGTLSCWTPSGN